MLGMNPLPWTTYSIDFARTDLGPLRGQALIQAYFR